MNNAPKNITNQGWAAITQVPAISKYLAHEIIPANPLGFTFDLNALGLVSFDSDEYTVSIHGHEKMFEEFPDVKSLQDWLAPRIFILSRPEFFVGWWFDDKKCLYYIDVSVAIVGKGDAILFGYQNDQKAIYHPATSKTIYLPPYIYI